MPVDLLEVSLVHPYEDINTVEEVWEIVEQEPHDGELVVEFPEDGPAHHEGEVVEDGQVDEAQPVVVIWFTGIHN